MLDALAKVDGADVTTGGDSTLQLQLQAAGGGAFDPASYGGDAAVASAVRRAFLLTVPRDAIVSDVIRPLWPEATVAGALLPTVGPDAGGDVAPSGPADIAGARRLLADAGVTEPVVVRVLANTTDPLRAEMLTLLTATAADVGFEVEPYTTVDGLGPDLRRRAGRVGRGARAGAAVRPARRLRGVPVGDGWRHERDGLVRPGHRRAARARSRRASTRRRSTRSWPRSRRASRTAARCSRSCGSPWSWPPGRPRQRRRGARPRRSTWHPLALGRADLTSWWAWARSSD